MIRTESVSDEWVCEVMRGFVSSEEMVRFLVVKFFCFVSDDEAVCEINCE